MQVIEAAQCQEFLRNKFGTERIKVIPPKKAGQPVEVHIGDEFIGVLHKDEDEGEVCYHFQMTILDIDIDTSLG